MEARTASSACNGKSAQQTPKSWAWSTVAEHSVGRVHESRKRNETLFAARSAVCCDRLRGCVNLAGARKRILRFALPSISIDVTKARTLQFWAACLSLPKTVALWFSHPRKVQILFALCPSLVIDASWATTPTLPAVGSKIDTPGTCGFVE